MRWALAVQRDALAELRRAGPGTVAELQAMAAEVEPWAEDRPLSGRVGLYERATVGYWIGYEVDRADHTLRVLYIQPAR